MAKFTVKESDYHSYCSDQLSLGEKIRIDHYVADRVDITPLIVMGIDGVVAMREESVGNEQKAFDNVISAAKQWEHHAAVTQAIDQALKYLRMPEVPHTYNQWEKSESYRFSEEISNRVYMMYCSIWENTRDDRVTKQSVPVAWYVSWNVIVNSPLQGYREKIAGQNNKRFTDKDAALKYLEGRKKAYAICLLHCHQSCLNDIRIIFLCMANSCLVIAWRMRMISMEVW